MELGPVLQGHKDMASLEGNKIFAAIISGGLIAALAAVSTELFYHQSAPEENAYAVDMSVLGIDTEAEEPEEDVLEPIGALLASADIGAGEALTKKCASCHSFDAGGANKVGPALYGIVDRTIGSVDGYGYSGALADMGGVWDYEALNGFLANPKGWAPGTKMAYRGLTDTQDRADLVAYLRGLSESPSPLPGE